MDNSSLQKNGSLEGTHSIRGSGMPSTTKAQAGVEAARGRVDAAMHTEQFVGVDGTTVQDTTPTENQHGDLEMEAQNHSQDSNSDSKGVRKKVTQKVVVAGKGASRTPVAIGLLAAAGASFFIERRRSSSQEEFEYDTSELNEEEKESLFERIKGRTPTREEMKDFSASVGGKVKKSSLGAHQGLKSAVREDPMMTSLTAAALGFCGAMVASRWMN